MKGLRFVAAVFAANVFIGMAGSLIAQALLMALRRSGKAEGMDAVSKYPKMATNAEYGKTHFGPRMQYVMSVEHLRKAAKARGMTAEEYWDSTLGDLIGSIGDFAEFSVENHICTQAEADEFIRQVLADA